MTARRDKENMDKYRERRAIEKIATNKRLAGTLIWNSMTQGTYIRKQHGEIGERAGNESPRARRARA